MKKKLQKNLNFKAHCTFMFMLLILLGSNSVKAQFNATWPFASGLTATVTGVSSSNLSATTATYTSGTGGLFTGAVTTNTGFLNGTGISGKSSTSCSSLFNAVGSSAPITPYLEYKLAPNAGYSMTTNSFTFTVEQTVAVTSSLIAAGYSVDGGVSFTGLAAPTGGGTGATMAISPSGSYVGTTAGIFTFTVPSATITATNSFILRIVIWRNNTSSSSSANFKISPPVITGTTPVDLSPVITTPSPSTLTNFNYAFGNGPSTSQPFVVSGANLTGNLVLTPSANYELSSDNSAFSNSAITISPISGSVATKTLYARLKSGLTAGSYATVSGTPEIVISSTGATSQNLACSGYVTTNYYHDGTVGTLATIGNWWTSPGGVGSNPTSPTFTSDPYNTFYIYANATTTVAWPLGTLSKIVVGNGSTAANFTIDPSYSCTGGSIDVNAGATLTVAHSTSPTLGTLSPTSTVEYTATTAAIPSKTFGHLKITGATTVATQASGVTTLAGNLTLSNGAIYKISNSSSGSILSIGGNFNSSGTGGITTTSILSSATSAALTLTGTGKNIDNTANTNDFSKLNLNINGTYSLANDFNYNTVASTARIFTIGASGSLDLNGKKLGLDNSGSVVITTGGTFTATGTGSTVEYNSTAAQTLSLGISYKNLTISGASIKTLSGVTTVSGTLSILGGSSINTAGFSLSVSTPLTLSENSTITLGTSAHTVSFAASNAAAWTAGKTLTITGWTGTAGTTGTAGQIFFGSTAAGLTATQLGQIAFNISSINYGAKLLSTGELVPSATVLPIQLLSFTGKKENNVIQLNWSTASETNNLRFDILRAGADKSFQKIGEVNGNGNSNSTHYYNLSDRKPLAGINYYKLSQVDFDGQSQEFGPIAITSELNAASLEVYAAPDHSQIIVFVSSNETKEASLNIFDVSGRSLIKQSVSLQEGLNKFIIPANSLNKGIHLIEFSSREGHLIRKFIN